MVNNTSKLGRKRTDSAYTDLLALKRSGLSSAKVAASLTEAVVNSLLNQLKEEFPNASDEYYLNKLRAILFM